MTTADRHAWAEPGAEDLGGGVYRIPLPLPMKGLRAVNVYALADEAGVDLIDGGIALVQAREELAKQLRQIGYELGDIRNFFVTHIHHDHYTLAVELRRTVRSVVALGEGERANLLAVRELIEGGRDRFAADLRRLGAMELAVPLAVQNEGRGPGNPQPGIWEEDPDRWLPDGADLDLRSRTLRAVHTPGHTRGHLVFHDAAARIMFAGDHVLPHITPSIGFEPAANPRALYDYLGSLRRTLTLPDARLLPAHGPAGPSTHTRVAELIAHHDDRLEQTLRAVRSGNATAYEAARAITWTRRNRAFGDLDLMSQFLAVNETAAHLEVLAIRGQLTRETSADGTDRFQLPPPANQSCPSN
jgi:glyoxylase-like metal-dependent hydrolase (beta-lactamase superfamily II)